MSTYEVIGLLLQALTIFGIVAVWLINRPTLKAANGLLKLFDFDKIEKMVEIEKTVVRAEERESARKVIDEAVAKWQESEKALKLTAVQGAQTKRQLLVLAITMMLTIPPEAREKFIENDKLDQELKKIWSIVLPAIQNHYYPVLPTENGAEATLAIMMKGLANRRYSNVKSVAAGAAMRLKEGGQHKGPEEAGKE
jgi:hypothetical protein